MKTKLPTVVLLVVLPILAAPSGGCRRQQPGAAQPSDPAGAGPAAAAPDQPGESGPVPDERLIERGSEVVRTTFETLRSNLMTAMQTGGLTNAVQFCSVHAIPLTDSAGREASVVIRRVSHRCRNPRNAASDAERERIEGYAADLEAGRSPEPSVATLADGTRVYYAPIVLENPLCLNCHGDPGVEIGAGTLAVLERLYPEDAATGFDLGEIRGLWRVDFGLANGDGPVGD